MISTAVARKNREVRMALEHLRRRFVRLRLHDDVTGEVVFDVGDAVQAGAFGFAERPPL